ncbi:MAG TPA: hypothetical protein VM029_14340 [Opitutaceae bacterium]|nr:hypothetical protein [Opitutaceae bacterium]
MISTDRTGPAGGFTYRACSCQAIRTFRLHRPLPVVVEFFAIRYSIELFTPGHAGGSERLVARLPWQDLVYARELDHAGHGILGRRLLTAYDVDCGTLAEILFLRLARQGDADELAGPHLKIFRA